MRFQQIFFHYALFVTFYHTDNEITIILIFQWSIGLKHVFVNFENVLILLRIFLKWLKAIASLKWNMIKFLVSFLSNIQLFWFWFLDVADTAILFNLNSGLFLIFIRWYLFKMNYMFHVIITIEMFFLHDCGSVWVYIWSLMSEVNKLYVWCALLSDTFIVFVFAVV